MGILNVTPDSFSDGGDWYDHDRAVAHGLEMVARGAVMVDVGGESTRPGIARTTEEEELRRVLPVVTALAQEGVAVSIDTMRAEVARRCVEAGVVIVNDVSGGLADEAMLPVVAELGVPFVAMHWRAHSTEMQQLANYRDVVAEVRAELAGRAEAAFAAGIAEDRLVLDPGLGFAKDPDHNWELLRRLDEIESLGFPVLVGASRKRFLGELLARDGVDRAPKLRDAATAAITTWCAQRRIWAVRTHSVRSQRDAVEVVERLRPDA
ncbi:dihydropteroate synthase [Mariniluteicoccus endophyticus]